MKLTTSRFGLEPEGGHVRDLAAIGLNSGHNSDITEVQRLIRNGHGHALRVTLAKPDLAPIKKASL